MPVTDFECAIAKSQITRFIAGENLGGDVEQQLESHIDACPKCREVLEAKKQSLMQEIEAAKVNQAVVSDQASKPVSKPTPQQIRNIESVRTDSVPSNPEEAEQNRIREQFKARKTKKTEEIEIPMVAAAFAPKDGNHNPSTKIRLEEKLEIENPTVASKAKKNRSPLLSKLALFRRVPTESEPKSGPQPPISMEALKAANKQLRSQEGGFTKPLLFMLGLAIIVGAMSFVVKEPTKLLGTKAIEAPVSKKTTDFVATKAKKTSSKATAESGTLAQEFLDEATTPVAEAKVQNPVTQERKANVELTDSANIVLEMAKELTRFKPLSKTTPKRSTPKLKTPRPELPKIIKPIKATKPIIAKAKKEKTQATKTPTKLKQTKIDIAPTPQKRTKRIQPSVDEAPKPIKKREAKTPPTKKISTPAADRSDSAVKVYDSKGNPIQ